MRNKTNLHAKLVSDMIDEEPWKSHMWARCALMIAARAIRRGRHLTDEEKLENLWKALQEQKGDE